ncbi:hypothetical protein [Streptomyces californicus]|uniref:hypothetical protein n=1 Tax=Streptomyces californicus TaxID=67351 RepID=UPI00296FE76F|nr:hypothetical protein [Streptomyces californicus]MDW4912541.1 hypothetical protein [Streptomyces californicus]
MSIAARTPHTGGTRTAGCLRLLTFPFRTAHRLFRPNRYDRIRDPAITAAQVARTAVGGVATVWLIRSYPLQESAADVAKDQVLELLLSAGVLIVAGPVAVACFVLSARPPARAVYVRRLSGPAGAFAALLGSAAALWFLLLGGAAQVTETAGGVPFVGVLASMAGVVFGVPFIAAAVVLSVHYSFRVGDVCEVLPPLLSPVLVWSLFVFQALDGSPVAAPQAVEALFATGPPLSVSLLSAWELQRLRTRHRLTIRRALGRSSALAS